MVYISSPMITMASRQGVMQAQSDLSKAQQELSSGTLADAGLTLGGRSGQLVSLSEEQKKLQSITDSNVLATTRLSSTSAAIDAIRTAASSFLASLTSASSGSGTTDVIRLASDDLGSLTGALNTVVAGQYVFGGINTATQPLTPYTASPASANKQAVDTAFTAAFSTLQTSTAAASLDASAVQNFLDGSFAALFDASSFGTSWSAASDQPITSQISGTETATTSVGANQVAFRQLAQAYTMVKEFGGGNLSATATRAVYGAASTLVSQAISGLTDIQSGIGIAQNAITHANDGMASQMTILTTQTESLAGVDSYALTTRVSSLQTQIEASYELTAKLQRLSLVNYLA